MSDVPRFRRARDVPDKPEEEPQDDSKSTSNSTFSSIRTPDIAEAKKAMQAMPPVKVPTIKASKLRRRPTGQQDIAHVFRKIFGKEEFRGQQEAARIFRLAVIRC